MTTFIHKPYKIDATQWNAPGDHAAVVGRTPPDGNVENTVHVLLTDFGDREIKSGDWIATDANGNHHIFSDEYMSSNYDAVEADIPMPERVGYVAPDSTLPITGNFNNDETHVQQPESITENPLSGLANFPGI